MRMDRYLPPKHPLSRIYRTGAAAFGAGLLVFGSLGLSDQLAWLSTRGVEILGLSSNGLLSVLSLVVGLILIGAAAWGGALASTTTSVIGVLFFLSGLANLAVLDTSWNLLAFKMPNVVFSLIAGMLLMFLGLYGRVSGGLADDNPYVLYRHHRDPPDELPEQRRAAPDRELDAFSAAEIAFAEGHPTLEQERMVRIEMWRRAQAERERAYAHYRATHPDRDRRA